MSAAGRTAAPRRRRMRIRPRAVALVILVGALLVAFVYPMRTYLNQRSQISSLKRQELVLEQQDAGLAGKISRLHDPAYLELLARECLGMVKPGEVSFVVVPGSGTAFTPAC